MATGQVFVVRKKDQKVPNIFIVQAAPLLQYIETNESLCVCVCMCCCCFFLQYVRVRRCKKKVWITRRFPAGHCTASHCMGLYKEITLKWPIIYTDEVRGRWSRARRGLQEEKKGSSAPSFKLLALFFIIFFFFLSSKCSSSLDCGPRCCFLLQQKVCANVCGRRLACVACIAANCIKCDAANYCALLGCFVGSMHWMLWKQNKQKKLLSLWFFLLYISVCFCFMCTAAAKSKSNNVCVCEFLKHESASAVCVFGNSQRVETSTRSE